MAQQPPYQPVEPPPYPEQSYSPRSKGEPDVPAPDPHDVTFGSKSMFIYCPRCNLAIESKIRHEAGKMAWLTSVACFVFGGLLCCWWPFCWKCTRDVKHTCPRCGYELGFHRRC